MQARTKRILVGVGIAGALIGVGYLLRRKRAGELGLADGEVKSRIGDLQDEIWEHVRTPQMRELAIALTARGTRQITFGRRTIQVKGADCPPRDGRCEADAVTRWVASNRQLVHELSHVPYGPDRPAAISCSLISLNGVTCQLRAAKQKDGTVRIYSMAGLPKLRPSNFAAADANLVNHYSFGRELPKSDYEDFDG